MGPALNDLKHQVMRDLSAERGLAPPLDMQAFLYEQRNRAYLWWDFIHMRDPGHLLFAERLAEELLPIMKGLRAAALAPDAPMKDEVVPQPSAQNPNR